MITERLPLFLPRAMSTTGCYSVFFLVLYVCYSRMIPQKKTRYPCFAFLAWLHDDTRIYMTCNTLIYSTSAHCIYWLERYLLKTLTFDENGCQDAHFYPLLRL